MLPFNVTLVSALSARGTSAKEGRSPVFYVLAVAVMTSDPPPTPTPHPPLASLAPLIQS